MRRTALFIALLTGLFGAAYAQIPTISSTMLTWDSKPSGREFSRYYPGEAFTQGISGTTILCCSARADRKLSCRAGAEWPTGKGFGKGAIKIAEAFRMSKESLVAYEEAGRPMIRLPITMKMSPVPKGWEEAAEQFKEANSHVCSQAPPP